MIYLDYCATTPPNKEVLELYNQVSTEYFANSNSLHNLGVKSKELEEYATNKIKRILKLENKEVIYTSGATESNNLAIKGICNMYKNRGNHIITTKLEHSSIKETIKYLEKNNFIVDYVDVLDNGEIDINHLKKLLTDKTILVSICAVDSELGIKQPIEEIGKLLKNYPKCYFHSDCTQAIGKININFDNIDLASVSAHKIYGLKGIGLLIKNNNLKIEPLIHGGKSTTEYRSGTPALPLIVSIMKSLELIIPNIEKNKEYINKLSSEIKNNLKNISIIHINSTDNSIPQVINFSIKSIKPETFLHYLDSNNICISTKSACSNSNEISLPVYAVTKNLEYASSSLRISISHLTTKQEIEKFIETVNRCCIELNLEKWKAFLK